LLYEELDRRPARPD